VKPKYAISAIVGGLLWFALHLALIGAWERGDTFPTYEFLNALRPLPLALFAFALYGLYCYLHTGRTGFFIAVTGLLLLAAGAALEFWIGGGVRDGDVDTLSLVGWLVYLAGYLTLGIGLSAFGIAVLRARVWGTYSYLPSLTGLVWSLWLPSLMLGEVMSNNFSELPQYLFAFLWVVMGVLLWKATQVRFPAR
jgi:hypothetical protein